MGMATKRRENAQREGTAVPEGRIQQRRGGTRVEESSGRNIGGRKMGKGVNSQPAKGYRSSGLLTPKPLVSRFVAQGGRGIGHDPSGRCGAVFV